MFHQDASPDVQQYFLEDFMPQCDGRLVLADDSRAFLDLESQMDGISQMSPMRRFHESEREDTKDVNMDLEEGETLPIEADNPDIKTCAPPISPSSLQHS